MNLSILNKPNFPTSLRGVKALIYNNKGQILLQKRDNKKTIPMPNFWNLFGGLVEINETPIKALKRELIEELSMMPGNIEKLLFKWIFKNEWQSTINYFYPVKYNNRIKKLILNEGQSMKWFALEELNNINCTQSIYENLSKIFIFLSKNSKINYKKAISNFEKNFIKNSKLNKKNNRVYYAKNKNFNINTQQIFFLKELSLLKKINVSRICLHTNDNDLIHEMIMIHTKKTKIGPLKQLNNLISYHIIHGSLEISTLNSKNKIYKKYLLNQYQSTIDSLKSIRIKSDIYRVVKSLSETCIFLETTNGPFKDSDTIWLNK